MTEPSSGAIKKCPQCSYNIEDPFTMRCPRCYKTLLQACSCRGNCSHCGESIDSEKKCKSQ